MESIIPKSWNQVPLYKGKEFFSLPSTGLTENEYFSAAYNILTDQEFEKLTLEEGTKIKQEILSLLQTQDKEPEINYVYLNNYYLEYDLSRIPFGLFIDLERIIEQSENNIWKNIDQLMSCLIRPKKLEEKKSSLFKFRKPKVEVSNYELEDYDFGSMLQRSQVFNKELTTQDAMNVLLFFSLIGINYLTNISLTLNQTQ